MSVPTSTRQGTVAILMFAVLSFPIMTNATPSTRQLELTQDERESLERTACHAAPDSIVARRHQSPPLGDYAEVQCRPYATHRGHPVSQFVQCSRSGEHTEWQCQAPIATIRVDTGGRTILVRHRGATVEQALTVVSYLLTSPAKNGVHVDPDWLTSVTWVFATGERLTISSGARVISVRMLSDAPARFEVEQIIACETDTCVPEV